MKSWKKNVNLKRKWCIGQLQNTYFFHGPLFIYLLVCVCVCRMGSWLQFEHISEGWWKGLRLARLCWKTTKKLNPYVGSIPDISSGYWFAISTKDSCTGTWNCIYIYLLSKTGGNWDQNSGLSLRRFLSELIKQGNPMVRKWQQQSQFCTLDI